MERVKYLILGAGPAGLSLANLILRGDKSASFIVLEKESVPGGLCRSEEVDNAPIDVAGGHFLDVRRPKVNEFLFTFMPEKEWDRYDRDSRIDMGSYEIGHPFEANIWQMPVDSQVKYLKAIALAGCNLGEEKPEGFVEWIRWKLGDLIADEYMLPYNSKMFGGELDSLGTYWLDKLPNVSFEDTLYSCLNKRPYGTQPGHASFYYPKEYGYGELWLRMGKALGESLRCSVSVETIDVSNRRVTCSDGSEYEAEKIITTIPWTAFKEIKGADPDIIASIGELKHTGTEIKYVKGHLDTKAHWIYVPDPDKAHHRILVRHNFCRNSEGYWLETNLNRVDDSITGVSYKNDYTYPLNTKNKPEIMHGLLTYMHDRGITGLGRWGEHEHYNSDKTVERAMEVYEQECRS
ncbi:MAG: FAD-dependent oxidoreductase [Lachnospiraceae bacterium]|nr:FAD-dependent oxidoreductase [Lachnospiraceae bacterium]